MKLFQRMRRWRVAIGCTAGLLCAAAAAVLLLPMDVERYLEAEPSGELLDRHGGPLHAYLNPDEQWCFPASLDAVSPYLREATLAVEDQRFMTHPGVDAGAVARAFAQNVRAGGVVSGASTITMQLVTLGGERRAGLAGKAWQALQAVRLDARVGKGEILEAYLNAAPYGLNLVGCEAAARRYFGKPASELTLAEAALLAGLPKSPALLDPLRNPERARARRNHVLHRMFDEGYIGEARYRNASAAPLGAAWHDMPCLAPHLAARFRNRTPRGHHQPTTLDQRIQAMVERELRIHLRMLEEGITNGAAMVADVQEGSVLAWAGSSDFFHAPGGQVDMVRAPRSPGSALKPFTYALAMEHQCLYPCEMMHDGSLDYGLYQPLNYDQQYRGLVPASYALSRSLNVPAVTVLERLGYREVYGFLERAGLTTLERAPDYYGLGLTLGNCEVRMDELTAAYCALANLGTYRPLRVAVEDPGKAPLRVLTPDVCLAVYAMLEQPLPGTFHRSLVPKRDTEPRVCWKTGTSTGHRDAWCVMFNRHYVVTVWVGNSDGSPHPSLVGARAALPLAAKVFEGLPRRGGGDIPAIPGAMRPVRVCAATGLPASKWCPHTREVALPRSLYTHRRCDVHCPAEDGRNIAERWPGQTKDWDLARVETPLPTETCDKAVRRRRKLEVLAPAHRGEYVLTGEQGGDRIRLKASVDATGQLHWYADGRYLGASDADNSVYFELTAGPHAVTCMTAGGETDTVEFEVTTPSGTERFAG